MKQEMRQELQLSAQLVQYMQLLQMNQPELQDYLNRLYEENPAVELTHTAASAGSGSASSESLDLLENLSDGSETETLRDAVLNQLNSLSPEAEQAAQLIADNLNASGWLDTDLPLLAEESGISLPVLEEALDAIQHCEPKGLGARSLEECLLLQVEGTDHDTPLFRYLVRDGLHALAHSRWRQLSMGSGASEEEVKRCAAVIRGLNPKPGACFGKSGPVEYVIPDVIAVQFEDHMELVVNESDLPHISVSTDYQAMMKSAEDSELKTYLQEKVGEARQVVQGLEQRKHTLLACVQVIVSRQQPFFRYGPGHLMPLRMQDAADVMEVSLSTVSRAVRGKYLQCGWGVFPLSYFFSRELHHEGNDSATPDRIRSRLKQLIDGENPVHPLSDQKLSELLAAEGLGISRRTTAKYREELGIPAASGRRIR